MSLEPTFDLVVAYSLVCFSSLVSIILSPFHSLLIGTVSSLSSVSIICFNHSVFWVCWGLQLLLFTLFATLANPSLDYKQVQVTHYASSFVSKSFLGHLCCKIDSLFFFFRM